MSKKFSSPDESEFSWVAHPDIRNSYSENYIYHSSDEIRSIINEEEEDLNFLIENRNDIEVLGGWATDNYHYAYNEYDDVAIIRLFNKYYILNTVTSSFSSDPNETWFIESSLSSIEELKDYLAYCFNEDNYSHILKHLNEEELKSL